LSLFETFVIVFPEYPPSHAGSDGGRG